MTEIDRLTKRLKDQQVLLDKERERKKKKPNVLMAEEAGLTAWMDFWCDNCQEDFTCEAYKTTHRLYGDPIVVWRAKCPVCEEESIRHITHKDEDPYYQKSDKIRRQRNEYSAELLQAEEYGFKTHYGDHNKEWNVKYEEHEKGILKLEHEKGLKGLSKKSQDRLKLMAKRAQNK